MPYYYCKRKERFLNREDRTQSFKKMKECIFYGKQQKQLEQQ